MPPTIVAQHLDEAAALLQRRAFDQFGRLLAELRTRRAQVERGESDKYLWPPGGFDRLRQMEEDARLALGGGHGDDALGLIAARQRRDALLQTLAQAAELTSGGGFAADDGSLERLRHLMTVIDPHRADPAAWSPDAISRLGEVDRQIRAACEPPTGEDGASVLSAIDRTLAALRLRRSLSLAEGLGADPGLSDDASLLGQLRSRLVKLGRSRTRPSSSSWLHDEVRRLDELLGRVRAVLGAEPGGDVLTAIDRAVEAVQIRCDFDRAGELLSEPGWPTVAAVCHKLHQSLTRLQNAQAGSSAWQPADDARLQKLGDLVCTALGAEPGTPCESELAARVAELAPLRAFLELGDVQGPPTGCPGFLEVRDRLDRILEERAFSRLEPDVATWQREAAADGGLWERWSAQPLWHLACLGGRIWFGVEEGFLSEALRATQARQSDFDRLLGRSKLFSRVHGQPSDAWDVGELRRLTACFTAGGRRFVAGRYGGAIPPDDLEQVVNGVVDRFVEYLVGLRRPGGSWSGGPGCGVPELTRTPMPDPRANPGHSFTLLGAWLGDALGRAGFTEVFDRNMVGSRSWLAPAAYGWGQERVVKLCHHRPGAYWFGVREEYAQRRPAALATLPDRYSIVQVVFRGFWVYYTGGSRSRIARVLGHLPPQRG